MKTVRISTTINASPEAVWHAVIGEDTYPQWTESFSPGSCAKGDWSIGSKMYFLGDDGNGGEGGMVSTIAENRLHEYISIKHEGIVHNGVEDYDSEHVQQWAPAYENYTFRQVEDGTEFSVENDIQDEDYEGFKKSWELALQKLKDLAEGRPMSTVTVAANIHAPIEQVWKYWTQPEHITQWNAASDDWECPTATNDLRVGGTFSSRMQAKDGSMGFDFGGTYTAVKEYELIEYDLGDSRHVTIQFMDIPGEFVSVKETFDIEQQNSADMQRQGWQSIMNNFKQYTESDS